MKYLFIAEKPSAMREYKTVYNKYKNKIDACIGGEISFIALRGHIFRNKQPSEYERWDKKWHELYKEDLPMIPDKWGIAPISGTSDVRKAIKTELAKGYNGIIVGTDSDVEGYGIYYMVCMAMGLQKYKTLRFFETALTERDILNSFLTMEDMYTTPRHINAIQAYLFRSKWDWLIGMNLTTAYTVRYGELIKYGSVKAPTLKLIYDNCNAIDNFVKKTNYGVKSIHDCFTSVLINDNDNKERSFENINDANKVIANLKDYAVVNDIKRNKHVVKPPKLYSLSDLQIDAAKAPYGYAPHETLEIAQSLYEKHKLLTYPRTSGNYLSSGKVKDMPSILKSMMAIPEFSPVIAKISTDDLKKAYNDNNIFNDKEVQKASHDALIPTGATIKLDALNEREKNVFMLVCKRLLLHFMPYYVEEKTVLSLENNGYTFRANGRKVIDEGFHKLLGLTMNDAIIPDLKAGDNVPIKENKIQEKVSRPPDRYTMGTIIKAMKNIASEVDDVELKKIMKESEGIGTEATRSGIIKELVAANYITTQKNNIYITEMGKRYIEHIRQNTGSEENFGLADPMKVAYWSAQNKKIQLGERKNADVMEEFIVYLNKTIADIKNSGSPIIKNNENKEKCPVCDGVLINGKYGVFCSNRNKGCMFSIPNTLSGKKLTPAQQTALKSGKKVTLKNLVSKAGKPYSAIVKYNFETCKIDFLEFI